MKDIIQNLTKNVNKKGVRNMKGKRIYDLKQISKILEEDRLERLALKKQNATK